VRETEIEGVDIGMWNTGDECVTRRMTDLEASRHPLLKGLGCLGVRQSHVLVLLLQIRPVLHHARDLLAMRFLKALLGFLCLEYVLCCIDK